MSQSPLSRIYYFPKRRSIQLYSKFENAKAATFSENLGRQKQLRRAVWRYQKFFTFGLSTSQDRSSCHVKIPSFLYGKL